MSWKLFVPFLMAAAVLGSPVRAPRLASPIPMRSDPRCDYAGAIDRYLLGYAYARERPDVAAKFLAAAEDELRRCEGDHAELSSRLSALKASLP